MPRVGARWSAATAILDGRQPAELQLDELLDGFPLEWEGQRRSLVITDGPIRAV